MTDQTERLTQKIEALTLRVEDVATAFARLREELDVNTASVRDLHLWVVHKPVERKPELKPNTPHEG